MPTQFPRRFIGFNAFGLCFDRKLGATNSDPRNFFEYLRANHYPFNVVKVVPFSNSTQEVLPANAIPLYRADQSINPEFLNNLVKLVDKAAEKDFKVQVCLFHYHAVADKEASPENMPITLDYTEGDRTVRARLRKFFTPTINDPIKQKQKQLVAAIGQKLAGKTNVLWELANEVRMDGRVNGVPVSEQEQIADNWNLVAWLEQMENALKQAAGNDIQVTTSTGTLGQNEKLTCNNVPMTYFDFHMGQWNEDNRYRHFIEYAKTRASQYDANNPLVCNDDGAKEIGAIGATPDNVRSEGNLKNWAGTAFQMGLGYMLKASYPSKVAWNIPAMRAIKFAHEANPLPAGIADVAGVDAKAAGK